jgi:hypothetical protein
MILGARHTIRHVTSISPPWRLVRFQNYVSTSSNSLFEARYPAAEQLKAIPPWSAKKGKRLKGVPTGDKTRVNIVSEKLCGRPNSSILYFRLVSLAVMVSPS